MKRNDDDARLDPVFPHNNNNITSTHFSYDNKNMRHIQHFTEINPDCFVRVPYFGNGTFRFKLFSDSTVCNVLNKGISGSLSFALFVSPINAFRHIDFSMECVCVCVCVSTTLALSLLHTLTLLSAIDDKNFNASTHSIRIRLTTTIYTR